MQIFRNQTSRAGFAGNGGAQMAAGMDMEGAAA